MSNGRILVGIPTRDRQEYLGMLLATLLFQDYSAWDLLIVDTSASESPLEEHPVMQRYLPTIRALGHQVIVEKVSVSGRSEATAVNRILVQSTLQGYDAVYKVDDDHILPPKTLGVLYGDLTRLERDSEHGTGKYLVSGITPWMIPAWEGAYGPESVGDIVPPSMVEFSVSDAGELRNTVGHFLRYPGVKSLLGGTLYKSYFASAANFMMRPRCDLLWSDIGESSLFADAVWFLQLRTFLDVTLAFDTSVEVWHAAAPSGGVRRDGTPGCDTFEKGGREDVLRSNYLKHLLSTFGVGGPHEV